MEQYNIIRMLIVIIAGATIYFGYKLFYLVTERQGKLQIEGKDTNISLSDVGPGIFFALFGTFILSIVLYTQPYKEHITTSENESSTTSRVPASVNTERNEIALQNLCVDDAYNAIFKEGLETLSALEWFYENEKFGKISEIDKEGIVNFIDKGNHKEMIELSKRITTYEDYYIFMVCYLQYFYLHHSCGQQ